MPVSGLDDFNEDAEETFEEDTSAEMEILEEEFQEGDEDFQDSEMSDEAFFEEEVLLEDIFERNPVLPDVEVYEYETPQLYRAIQTGSRSYCETTEECVQELRTAMANRESIINIYYIGDEYRDGYAKELQDMAVAYDMALGSNTGDYLRYHYKSVSRRTFRGSSDIGTYYRFEYKFSFLSTAQEEEDVTAAMGTIMSSLALTGDTEKDIRAIFAYVTANVLYDSGDYEFFSVHSAYAAVIQGRAVCQGYATMLYRMLRQAGIDCRIVGGRAGSVNHAWIMVEIDGLWYFLDPTWDAGRTSDEWQYYLIGSEQFYKDHVWEEEYQTDPLFDLYEISEENYDRNEPALPEEIFLERMYEHLLGRHSDAIGLAYWMDMLQTGRQDSLGVLAGFLGSHEFSKKDITQTYERVRNLLEDEMFWQYADLNVSDETLLNVIRCYNLVLDRQPELGGLRYWCRKIDEMHISYKEVFKGFIFSSERGSRPLDDDEFLAMMYRVILYRQPYMGEISSWQEGRAEGKSREDFFEALTETDEYVMLYGE